MKNFFGSIFINRDELEEAGIKYPIKVEYYKIKYKEKIRIEQNKLEHITNDEKEIMQMLEKLKENEVTPVGLEDVIIELKKLKENTQISYNA